MISRILSIAITVAIATLPSVSYGFDVMSLIPQELLDKIPDACRESDDSEFQEAVNCAFTNLGACSAIIGKLQVFMNLPSAEEVSECEDVQEPFCEIATTCTPCIDKFDATFRCIFSNDPAIETAEVRMSNFTDDMLGNYTDTNSTEFDEFVDSRDTIAELVDSCALTCDAE